MSEGGGREEAGRGSEPYGEIGLTMYALQQRLSRTMLDSHGCCKCWKT